MPAHAAIESGSIVSHYRILGLLGAGGMGEVYRAQDQALGRTVALKILPAHLVRNEDRLRRFVQEAKAASSLNHPHIVTIHEIGEASPDGHRIQYIAMELIDGATLTDKIHHDNTSLRTLLGWLVQVAEGLAKAHAANIVHRDLKPENIMVTGDGYAKVLDFGLAKLVAKQSDDAQATPVRGATREGTILGTVPYMSPEQVRGKPADHRADIFAFGAILYEVCTRRQPFVADTDLDVMHKILHAPPPAIDELNPKVPAEVRRMVGRCLAKEPDKRYHSMKDVALELRDIVNEFEHLSASRTSQLVTQPMAILGPHRRMIAIAAVVVVLAAIGLGAVRRLRARGATEVAFSSMKVQSLTTTGNVMAAAISADGRYLGYVTHDEDGLFTLWVRQIATGTDVRIVGPAAAAFGGVVFTRDGEYLYYTQRDRAEGAGYLWLYQVPTLGGTPRRLISDIDTPVAFSPDGRQLAFIRSNPAVAKNFVMVANADGTGERTLATLQRFEAPKRPAWSPDGKRIVTSTGELSPGYRVLLYELDVATGRGRKLGGPWAVITDLEWLPDGRSVLLTATDARSGRSQVWLQPYPDGEPVRLTNDASDYSAATVTGDGRTIAAVQQQWDGELLAGDKPLTRLSNQRALTVSAARTGAVVCVLRSGADTNVAVIDAPGAPPRFLTTDGVSTDAAISADGRTVVYVSGAHVFAVNADGSGRRQVTTGAGELAPRVSGDGRTLLYVTENTLWTKPVEGSASRRITDRLFGRSAGLSEDGRSVVYQEWPENAVAGSTVRLKVAPVAGGPPLLDVPGGVAAQYRFHPDGVSLSFRRLRRGVSNIWTMPLGGGEPVQVTQFDRGTILGYDWLPDGRLVLCRAHVRNDVVVITDFLR